MKNSITLVRFLVATNLVLIGFVIFVGLTSFGRSGTISDFTEINVERINVLGENGKPIMVISNKKRIPGPSMNGKSYSRDVIDGRKYFSGILFFNELGDEVGGLIYTGIKKDSIHYSAVGHLSFDQWKQNQVLALDYNDNGKNHSSGLRIWDRPTNVPLNNQLDLLEALVLAKGSSVKSDSIRRIMSAAQSNGEYGVERMFIGSKDDIAQIQLKDKNGKIRARLFVDNGGEARLEFMNEKGEVTGAFPK